jgi:hypothetical protein
MVLRSVWQRIFGQAWLRNSLLFLLLLRRAWCNLDFNHTRR